MSVPEKVIVKHVVSRNIGVFVNVHYLCMASFVQEEIHYTSCFSWDSLDMYNDYICYTLDMADYFLVLIHTDILMI